ncbi:MAG: hypothetical protein WC384_18335 [Prolixibacteraceae bacterium]|jgi:hypothetical protein
MNQLLLILLKASRKLYTVVFGLKTIQKPECDQNPDTVSQTIFEALISDKPCMIARFGSTELTCMCNYLGIKYHKYKFLEFIKGNTFLWWWDSKIINQMQQWSGFFPANEDKIEQFCELMIHNIKELDILGSWLANETYFKQHLAHTKKIRLMYLDPYWSMIPWTKALKGKNILVVHPFAESIKKQYRKREFLFENQDILPEFKSLTVIKAVQSLGQPDSRFNDWFEALEYMKEEINKIDFDICLIGCGAYGFPLAAHVKRIGKKAVHIGGSLQLLFGIRGKRWENDNPHYTDPGNVYIYYNGLPNEYWVRPSENEKPTNHEKVENSCYW